VSPSTPVAGPTSEGGDDRATFSTGPDDVVAATGEIDLAGAPKLWDALSDLIERGSRAVVLDLSAVEFLDSQGIRVIVQAHKKLERLGGTLVVRAPQPQARTVLEVTGLSDLLQIED
jgi:anti-sigma B factor antagonist